MNFEWRLQANAHLCKKLSRLESRRNYLSPHGPGTSINSKPGPPIDSNATQRSSGVDPGTLPTSEMVNGQELDDTDDELLEEHEEQSTHIIDKIVDLFESSVIT